jgi:hypothetical protein
MPSHSIYHLINDSLMPELKRFSEPRLFRRLWRLIQAQLMHSEAHFIELSAAFVENKVFLHPDIKREWQQWAQFSSNTLSFPPFKKLSLFYPQQTKNRFFIFLFWQNIDFAYQMMHLDLQREASGIQKQYILMQFMGQLEQYLDDNGGKAQNEIRTHFQLLLSYYWLKGYQNFYDFLSIKALRYFEEELAFLFKDASPNSFIYELAKGLVPKLSQDLSDLKEESPALPIADLAKQVQADIKTVKAKLENMGVYSSDTKVYLRPKEAAKLLNIRTQTLSNWRRTGRLTDFQENGNRFEYSLQEIQKMIKKPH